MLSPLPRPTESLFWAAPLDDASEFTPEDPLALDYLAQQVGLWLFGAFTTRTSRAQNYAVVLYGLSLAQKALEKYQRPGDEDEARTWYFERWERFWALAVLESREGQLERGDPDAMRGVRGARRAWRPGEGRLPLDFKLISRQDELGSLGAYLSSLRELGLVLPGTLRPTLAARDIIEAFWDEPGNRRASSYEAYALAALDPDLSTLPRSHSGLSLYTVGERSRLTALEGRREQQDRLWTALFENARDDTLPLAKIVRAAARQGTWKPRSILAGALKGRWGAVGDVLRERLRVALTFGDVYQRLSTCFNAAYGALWESGWGAPREAVAGRAFPQDALKDLRQVCAALLDAPMASDFRKLDVHGRPFLELVGRLQGASPLEALEALLRFHLTVQKERRRAPWILEERDAGRLMLGLGTYAGFRREVGFPPLKLNVVQRLLQDLGRLPG